MHTHLALRRRSVPSDTRHIEAPGSLAVYLPSARSALISWLILSLLAVIDSRLTQFHHHSVRARPVAYSMGANAVIRHYFDLLRCPNPDNVFASGFARRPSRRITLSRRVEKTRSPPSRDRQSTSRQAAFHTRIPSRTDSPPACILDSPWDASRILAFLRDYTFSSATWLVCSNAFGDSRAFPWSSNSSRSAAQRSRLGWSLESWRNTRSK
jgi:hypothetical protein